MKKLLHKSCQWLVMLVAMFAVGMNAMAQDATIVTSSGSTSNNGVTISGGYGFQSGCGYLCQPNSQITISASQTITKIVLTENSNYRSYGLWSVAPGAMTYTSSTRQATWEGSAESVVFSNTSSSVWDYYGIDKVEVWFGGSTEPAVQPNFPVEGQAYQLKHNGRGTFLTVVENATKCAVLSDTQQALYFTWDADHAGFTITNAAGLYVGKATNDWNMSSSTPEYWAVQEADGGYVLKRTDAAKYLNFDSGNEAFRDKSSGAVFTIEPYQAPSAEQPSFPAEGVTYQLQLVDNYATNYLNLQKDKTKAALLGAAPQGFTFTWDADNKGFVVQNTDGLYLGQPEAITVSGIGSQTPDYWTVVQNGNSYYLKCSKGYLGFSSYNTGATATSNNANAEDSFIFTEYVAPDLTPFTIPSSFIRESTTEMQMGDQIIEQLAFVITASSDYGVEAFKLYPNGKAITFSVDGQSTSATLTCTQSGYCSITGMYPEISGEGNHNIVFPEGTFEAANGKVNTAFEYIYTIVAPGAVEYTVGIYGEWSQDGTLNAAPDGAYIVFKNAPGTPYYTGDKYVSEYVPSAADFACGIPYWEIDEQHSVFSEYGKSITIYLKRIPYQYYVTIEGNDNAGVKVNGVRYANGETVETYELLRRTDVTFLTYKGYNLITVNLQDPEDGKGGVIYAKYEAIQYAKATFDHANPAVGEISLDNSEGIHYLTLYFKEDLTDSQSFDGIPAGVTMTDEKGTTYTLSNFGGQAASEWMSSCINIATEKLISAPGTYTLHIPAGIFYFGEKEDMVNDELDLVWTITARQHYDLDNSAVQTLGERKDPTNEWSGLKTLTGFEITLPAEFDAFMFGLNKLYIAPEGGMYGEEINVEDLTEASGYSMGLVQGTNTIRVSFDQTLAPAEPTYYSYIIPAGAFRTTDGLTNKQINLSASVDPTVYFDLVVTYPAAGNAQAPVDHITVQLPEGLQVSNVDGTSINFNDYNATVEKFEQNGRELTITFADHAAQAGDEASYYIPSGAIVGTDITAPAAVVPMANSTAQQYNIPVTAAPVEYFVEFAGLEGVALPATPTVTYNNEQYAGDKHIIAVDLTVDQLTATDADGYGYVITIDQPGYVQSHGFGRILVTYTAKEYAAVSSVSPAEGEISLDNAEGLGSITIFMDGEAGWDENVYCGGGNPVPAGVSMVGPNGAIELPWEGSAYGFCMWKGSNQINVNFGGTLKTPGQYTLIIPAGLNTIGGKENPRMEYTWTVKEATTFEFAYNAATALGDRNNDGVQLSLTGFTVALPENLSDISTEGPGPVDLYITVSTGDEMSEEPAEPTLVSSTYSITDGVVTFTFPKAYTEKGRVSVTLNANNISINGLSNKAFSTSFYVDPNPAQYFSFTNADDLDIYVPVAQISTFAVTANTDVWTTVVPQLNAEMFADKTVTISYWDGVEQHMVNNEVAIDDVETGISVATFKFAEPAAVPFGTSFDVIFPEGFITIGNLVSEQVRVNNNKLTAMFQYNVVYDVETVPADAKLYNYNGEAAFEDGSVVGQLEDPMTEADFTATVILGKKPVFTIVQPTAEQPIGSVTFSYEDNIIFMAPEDVIYFETTVNAKDEFTSVSKIYINAPEGRTYETVDLSKFSYYVGEDLVAYPEDGISYELNEEQNVVTITLEPAYSTVGTFSWVILDGGLVLDGGTVYAGANYGIVIVPPYDYATVSRVTPAESTIALEDEYDGLRYVTIYFKEKITENFTAFSAEQLPDGFSFTDPDGKEITLEYLTGWADSDNIGITTKSLQRTLGEYKLHIPEGIFTFEGGKKNPALDYTWTVTAPSTFAMGYYDIAADGQVKSDGQLKNLYGFTLTAPEGVTFASVAADAKVIIPGEMDYETGTRTEDEEVEGATITLRENGTIYVGFEPAYAPAEYTSYSFVIPAGAIIAEDGRTSKEIRLSAGVDPVSYFDLATATEKETTSKANTFSTYTITSEYNAWANLTGLLTADSFKGEVEVSYSANVQSQPVADFTVNADNSVTLKFAEDFTVPFGAYYTVTLPAGFIAFPDLALTSKEAKFYNNIIFEKSSLEGVELNTYAATDTQEGITAACPSFGDPRGANIYDSANGAEGAWPWGIIKVSSDKTIRKVELTVDKNASSVMEKDAQGEFSVSGNIATWTGSSHALVFSASEDIYVSKLVVYYDADEVIVTENTVTLAESDTNGGQVGKIETHLNLTFTENFASTHSYYNGQTDIPAGVKLVRVDTPSEQPIAIEQFNYFDGKDYLSIVLAESVTAGGIYKLVIPEGILPFVGLKSNAETIVEWTISADDISLDGKEDVDDVIAIADIILETSNAERYDASKADLNDDGQVTIGDLVKYIEKLRETPVGETDPSQEVQ